jgi:RNA polymerase sigma factor (sigma-70 family)
MPAQTESGPGEARPRADDLVALDEALDELTRFDERKARVIEMRYFGGMSGEEIGAFLGLGTATVTRDLRTARAWLESYLNSGTGTSGLTS